MEILDAFTPANHRLEESLHVESDSTVFEHRSPQKANIILYNSAQLFTHVLKRSIMSTD